MNITKHMTVLEALSFGTAQLREAGVPDASHDATYLLSHVIKLERLMLHFHGSQTLLPEQEQRYRELLLCRTQREPLQYILAEAYFYGRPFYVDKRVLIPRQETETLCEIGLQCISSLSSPLVLDVCTGSGAIALTIKQEHPCASVSATDISADALAVAEKNALSHLQEITFYQGDLFAPIGENRYDLILSNPPYIESTECVTLQEEVLCEPLLALDGGDDGLVFYRRFANEAHLHLAKGGNILLEVGHQQAQTVLELFAKTGYYDQLKIHNDLYGVARIVQGTLCN